MGNRGSVWHKWDLHIHTPASFHWNGGLGFDVMNNLQKDQALADFITAVNDSDVDVFAIQDYWTFDWILALRDYIKIHKDELKKLILSGMELRIESPTNYRLNIHVVLSNKLTDQQLKDFKSDLQIAFTGSDKRNVSDEALRDFAKTLDASKAKVHGFGDPSQLSDIDLIKLGSMTAEVTKDSLIGAVNKLPKNTCFILLPYDTSDGLLKLDWKNHPQADNYFMQTAQIFESRDQRNIDLFAMKQTDENKDCYNNFTKTLGNIAKPCVSGSDAHKFTDYGKFPSNKATWIKSSLSFSGLEQILYEPIERIRIQELRPEEKSPQDIIDKVEFIGKGGSIQTVYLNQNLNSLIGSRAQGKSNLLKNIAYAVEPIQTRSRDVDTDDFLSLISLKVYWADGTEQTLDTNEEKNKGILFIPQKYLGELVYDKNPKFDEFLTSLFENKGTFQDDLAVCRKAEDQNTLIITAILKEMLEARRVAVEKQERIRKLGNKESFNKEIQDLEIRVKLASASGSTISEDELKEYNQLKSDEKIKTQLVSTIKSDVSSLNMLKNDGVIDTDKLDEYTFSAATYAKIQKELSKTDKNFKLDVIDKEAASLDTQKTNIEKEVTEITKKIAPLAEKIKKNETLASLTKTLEQKKATKSQLEELEIEFKTQLDLYNEKKKNLIVQFATFETEYGKLRIELGELKFSDVTLTISFDDDSFKRTIEDAINYHNSVEFKKDDKNEYQEANLLLNDPSGWRYANIDDFSKILAQLINGVLASKLILKTGRDRETVIAMLLKSRYKIDFLKSIKSKSGVVFRNMSDGEQMLTLLEFIFKFDDYNYPVLLDQPEDDLDSKAISSTVVEFIKTEKSTRQIIIASHNANLVVCGDSENVIVSQKTVNKALTTFSYISGAIEDDNTNKEIVEILEGGPRAFEMRRNKLGI